MPLAASPAYELSGLPPPIPLRVLFGNADKRLPRISADGRYYAYLADDAKGVTNVFVKRVSMQDGAVLHDAEPQQVTHETHRPVRLLYWTKSIACPRLLYVQDQAGNEQFHVFLVDFEMDDHGRVQQLSVRDLTPFDNVTVMSPNMTSIHLHKRFPDKLLVTLNKRDKRLFDLHCIDLSTGQEHVLVENPGDVANWIVNDEFHVWGCATANPKDGSMALRVRSILEQTDATQWKTVAVWPHGETGKVHAFSKDARGVYVETSIAHSGGQAESTNTSRLVLLSTADGSELEVIAQDPLCDLERVSFNEDTWRPQFVSFEYLTQRIEVLDADVEQDIEALKAVCVGSFYLVSASDDNRTWIVAEDPDNGSMKYYIYDRETRQYALLFDTRPELASYQLVRMRAHVIKTSDGEDMVAYLSLPHGVKADRLPFVLNVHGGPWGRNTSRFDPMHQFFANRGYGCLSVNFRGSVGFGKRWVNLGDLQWGGNMQQDLTDAVHWAISQGYADKDRVAIYGGSYGGYAVLAGLAFTPDLFACGVDIVGPSNLQTLLAATPAYWETMRKMLTLRIGPVETDSEFNERVSPLFHTGNMRKPLLIAQGANDPRVKQSESDQIARKLFDNKHEVQYVVYKDEGHGFARAVNKLHFTGRVEAFLAEHLGGRQEPLDASLIQGHSAVGVDVSTLPFVVVLRSQGKGAINPFPTCGKTEPPTQRGLEAPAQAPATLMGKQRHARASGASRPPRATAAVGVAGDSVHASTYGSVLGLSTMPPEAKKQLEGKNIWEEYYPLIQPAHQYHHHANDSNYFFHGMFSLDVTSAYRDAVIAFLVTLFSMVVLALTGLVFCKQWGMAPNDPIVAGFQMLWLISPAVASLSLRNIADLRLKACNTPSHWNIPPFHHLFKCFPTRTMLRLSLLSYAVPVLCEVAAFSLTAATRTVNPFNRAFVQKLEMVFSFNDVDALDSGLVFYVFYICFFGIFWDPLPPRRFDLGLALGYRPIGCSWFLFALVQEIGWSGSLFPALEIVFSHSTTLASAATGMIWALWHWPMIIADAVQAVPVGSGYTVVETRSFHLLYVLSAFTLLLVGARIIMCWIQGHSSHIIWSSVIYHATHKLFIISVFGQLTAPLYEKAEIFSFFSSEASISVLVTVWFSTCILSQMFRWTNLMPLLRRSSSTVARAMAA